MNYSTAPETTNFDWAKALLVSILVHGALIALWIVAILFEIFAHTVHRLVEEQIPADKYVTIPMEVVEALEKRKAIPAPEEREPEVTQKQFAPTRASQETTEEVTSDRYFGERSTAAASMGEVAEEGVEVPSQDGREARSPNDNELADSDFSDGETAGAPELPGDPVPPSQPSPSAPEAPSEELMAEETSENSESNDSPETTPLLEPLLEGEPVEPGEPPIPTEAERRAMEQARAEELMALEGSIPILEEQEEEDETEEKEKLAMVEPVEETLPEEVELEEPSVEESLPEPKTATPPQQTASTTPGNQGRDGGFDREARKTRMTGTIRRRGENSLEVEDTVKGRYFAQVNKQIEKAWQRECILRREHILPGVISVRFSVDDSGKVTAFAFGSRIAGGAIQEGFTMRAIQKAKIPEMPEEIKDEMNGSDLEMNLTFFF